MGRTVFTCSMCTPRLFQAYFVARKFGFVVCGGIPATVSRFVATIRQGVISAGFPGAAGLLKQQIGLASPRPGVSPRHPTAKPAAPAGGQRSPRDRRRPGRCRPRPRRQPRPPAAEHGRRAHIRLIAAQGAADHALLAEAGRCAGSMSVVLTCSCPPVGRPLLPETLVAPAFATPL
jgi:hypothetical protein